MFSRGRQVKSETKSKERNKKLFAMSLLTSRGKQRKQGLALNIASNSSSEKLHRELHRVVSPELHMPFEAYYCSTLSDGVRMFIIKELTFTSYYVTYAFLLRDTVSAS